MSQINKVYIKSFISSQTSEDKPKELYTIIEFYNAEGKNIL